MPTYSNACTFDRAMYISSCFLLILDVMSLQVYAVQNTIFSNNACVDTYVQHKSLKSMFLYPTEDLNLGGS